MKTLDLRNCCFLSTSLKLLLVFFTFLNICYSFSHSSFLLQKQVKVQVQSRAQSLCFCPKSIIFFNDKNRIYLAF